MSPNATKDRADILLRIPRALKFQLMAKADENQRSLNAEITKRLLDSLREQYRI